MKNNAKKINYFNSEKDNGKYEYFFRVKVISLQMCEDF